VAAGEVHALMGEKGAGKSTLAKIIADSLKPDRGRIFLDGKPLSITSPLDTQRLGKVRDSGFLVRRSNLELPSLWAASANSALRSCRNRSSSS
jgi:ABC-type bacteriocin/lantibiotic exporter with double-glycine peptidase domain